MEKMLRDKKTILFFILPALIVFCVFVPVPVISSIVCGFYSWDLIGSMKFIGLDNYKFLFTVDNVFFLCIRNTFVFLILSFFLQIPMAFFLANVLSKEMRGQKFFRNVIFLPVTFSGVVVSLIWYFIYHPEIGLINNFLSVIGINNKHFPWLGDPKTALVAVIISVAWQWVGYHMVIFLAGISTVPHELMEAAKIDGASEWQIVKNIIYPILLPMIKVSTILITTSSLKSFDSIYIMTQGGPNHATEVLASLMYTKSFAQMKFGYGSSISTILLILCVLCTLSLNKLFSLNNYES